MPFDPEHSDYLPLKRPKSSKFFEDSSERDVFRRGRAPRALPDDPAVKQTCASGADVANSERIDISAGTESDAEPKITTRKLILKRGHTISYVGLLLFTFVLYFRPYELIPALAGFSSLAFVLAITTLIIFVPTQFGLEGNISAPLREVKLVMLLCLAGLLSIPMAIVPSEAWKEFNDVFIKAVLMFIVIVNVIRTRRRLYGLLYLALAVTMLLSMNAVSDYRNSNFAVEGYRIKGLLGGMFGNPNDLALHFVTMMPLGVGLMLGSQKKLAKVIFGGCVVLIIMANVVTYSRGGFLGLIATVVVLAWKLGRKRRLAVAIIGPICISIFIALAPGNYGVRILSIFVPSLDTFGSASSRQEILNRSVITSLRNPIAGIGMGNFHTVSLHETVTHNAFTQVSAEMGFAALIVYLMFLTSSFRPLRRIERHGSENPNAYYYLSIGIQTSLIGYMVSAFFAAVAYQWYAYYLVAYAVCLRRIYQADEHIPIENGKQIPTTETAKELRK